jgi:hypothetical protein
MAVLHKAVDTSRRRLQRLEIGRAAAIGVDIDKVPSGVRAPYGCRKRVRMRVHTPGLSGSRNASGKAAMNRY